MAVIGNQWLKIQRQLTLFMNAHASCEWCLSGLDQPHPFLCHSCWQQLPFNSNACSHCAQPMAISDLQRCGQCQQQPPQYDYASTGYHYTMPLDRWLMQCKDQHSAMWHDRLQRLAADAFIPPSVLPDAIACIPATRTKRLQRGFNLSYSLACTVAQMLRIPLIHVFRLTPGQDQRGLSVAERQRNLRHSLHLDSVHWRQAQQQLDLQHVLLVDDVMTSGATFERAARLLQQQSVKLVGCWALARTLKAP